MSIITVKEIHERRVRRIFTRHELESVLGHIVHHEIRDQYGPDTDVDAVDYKLTFEDETEGSPGYKVGTRCIVDVIERLQLPIYPAVNPTTSDGTNQEPHHG